MDNVTKASYGFNPITREATGNVRFDFEDGVFLTAPVDSAEVSEWLSSGGLIDPVPAFTRDELRVAALARIDQEHEGYLVSLTGGATVAERDTWKVKEEAARALEAGTVTLAQSNMLALEASGTGVSPEALAGAIIAKADAFLSLIGTAARVRAMGRAAIKAATDDTVPLDQVEASIEATFANLATVLEAALAEFAGA